MKIIMMKGIAAMDGLTTTLVLPLQAAITCIKDAFLIGAAFWSLCGPQEGKRRSQRLHVFLSSPRLLGRKGVDNKDTTLQLSFPLHFPRRKCPTCWPQILHRQPLYPSPLPASGLLLAGQDLEKEMPGVKLSLHEIAFYKKKTRKCNFIKTTYDISLDSQISFYRYFLLCYSDTRLLCYSDR